MGNCSCKDKKEAGESEVVEAGEDPAGLRVVILGARGLREAEVFPGTE
eukprot:CAMPEP_0168459350 /NCGR_PEP_ID=MMETSP0228-20121227/52866_1 /TAXON_ID=133427 /ORGANISM="Protoceratium reticulatum, Strain CCCM 535 (=CCMP 1889)" /LENGTH=47 /DNA_ID= /DNA_START= /DNA_END= /DNA_ORIENTATION=